MRAPGRREVVGGKIPSLCWTAVVDRAGASTSNLETWLSVHKVLSAEVVTEGQEATVPR